MLALWFKDAADYDKISGKDKISILDLENFAPGKDLTLEIKHENGSTEKIQATHTYNEAQIGKSSRFMLPISSRFAHPDHPCCSSSIGFFRAGSALNLMAAAAREREASAA